MDLTPNQANLIGFVMIDGNGEEVSGLGAALTLELSFNGNAFAPGAGVIDEVSAGWYTYTTTPGEVLGSGTLLVKITHPSCIQQNLVYSVGSPTPDSIPYTYTLTNSVTGLPIEGAEIRFYIDAAMSRLVWRGVTDVAGVARDASGLLPFLQHGTYYVRRTKAGFTGVNPDVEVV